MKLVIVSNIIFAMIAVTTSCAVNTDTTDNVVSTIDKTETSIFTPDGNEEPLYYHQHEVCKETPEIER